MARLAATVHVHTKDGTVVYGPQDDVPAEHASLITNPKAWADPPEKPKRRK